MPRVAALVLTVVALAMLSGQATGAPGHQVKIHPHVLRHGFDDPWHRIQGTIGIKNGSSRTVDLRCTVIVLLDGAGTTHKRGRDVIRASVGAGDLRKPHFAVKIRDVDHAFDNVPTSVKPHCRQV